MGPAEFFEAFFLQADVDCDGVISGPEAVNFFKATDIPQPILAKIWKYADEGQRGFLSRQEFYNALKLITVAQTGRELTPELVKAALMGPAASQIPPPRLTPVQPFSNIKKTSNNVSRGDTRSSLMASIPSDVQPQLITTGLLLPSALDVTSALSHPTNVSNLHRGLAQAQIFRTSPMLGYNERMKGRLSLDTPWPKMTPIDVHRYVSVFKQLDTDEDGKITGDQTRDLFLSWQLPREVLRNVWTLSDEDGDNMLSIREFCTAVYLLEKFKDGFGLPSKLPKNIHLDEHSAFDKKLFNELVYQPKPSLPSDHSTLSTAPPIYLEDPNLANKGLSKQNSLACTPFISQNQESKEAYNPTQPRSNKPTTQVEILNKQMMSQKEKDTYYHSKLQEIELFKNKCGNKFAEMTEKVIVLKHEVNLLGQHVDLKSRSVLEEESKIKIGNEALECNQTSLDLIAVDLHELKNVLTIKARSLGVDIKRESPKKIHFGENNTISSLKELSITNSTKELSTMHNKHEEEEIALDTNIDNCLLHHALATNLSSIHESSNSFATSNPKSHDSTTKVLQIGASDWSKFSNENLMNNAEQNDSKTKLLLLTGNPIRETNTNAKQIELKSSSKGSTTVEENDFGYKFQDSKPHLEAEKGSIMLNETTKVINSFKERNSVPSSNKNNIMGTSNLIQDDNVNLVPQTSWSVQNNYQNSQVLSETKKSKSRGSFEPEDYFNLTPQLELSLQSSSNEEPTMALQKHNKTNSHHQEDRPNYFQP